MRREESCLGSCRSTFAMFACPALEVTLTSKDAPEALLALPCVLAVNEGLNGRVVQPPAWKRDERLATFPVVLFSSPVTLITAQLVGFRTKSLRFISTATLLISSGIPSRIVGNGSLLTVTCAVDGLMNNPARTTTVPRSNGPAIAGVTITKLNGAPSYGPAKYALPDT